MNATELEKLKRQHKRFIVRTRGDTQYWKPNGHGYCDTKKEAGKFTMEQIRGFHTYRWGKLEIFPYE